MELKELIVGLSSLMSISGYERYDRKRLLEIISPYFDENYVDNVGNQIFVKKCGKENAPKIMVDAHFDEIGMYVSDICEGGFLRVVNVGGIDTGIRASSRGNTYGASVIRIYWV